VKRQFWVLGFLALVLSLQGCKIENVSKDENDNEPTNTTEDATRKPDGISLTKKPDSGQGFTTPEFTEGPSLDLSKAGARALQEADVVQVAGNRLYTLSKAAGLSIIDLSVADQLKLIGQYRFTSMPFEMFVRGDTVIALLREVPIATDSGNALTSRIVSFDATTPSSIRELSHIDVPGTISEGRILDNTLYVASYESNSCYDCAENPTTTVASVNVADPANLRQVDRESFPEIQISDDWTKRSVEINDTRMYISGAESDSNSSIQVIDISDTSGNMSLGAKVPVQGAIYSRWQMDEYLGVLRVISQPVDFETQQPTVQTFTITNSSTITPLGSVNLTIPSREKLRSVRFDGTRAFAITYVKTDPLFTIDLSDPAHPRQAGELEMPGFVYHMEVKGDRIYGMGFEVGNEAGGLHVSLFDVADLAKPRMLSRVNFGPTFPSNYSLTVEEYLPENENRIHQVFKVMDDLGMILVPYQGWSRETEGCGDYQSAIQLVDFTNTTLTKRGAAPTGGAIRRAFIHNDRLLGVSEQHVDSFNLSNKDTLTRSAHLPLTIRAHRTIPVNDRVLRIRGDWWTHVGQADIVSLANVESAISDGTLNLSAEITNDTSSCEYHDDTPFKNAPVFTFGSNFVALVVVRPDSADASINVTDILVLDVSGSVPTIAATLTLDYEPINTGLGAGVTKVGDTLVIQRPGERVQGDSQEIELAVIDMTDPTHPRERNKITRPFAWGTTGLYTSGNDVASGYYTQDKDENVTFYLDRVNFSDAANPTASDPQSVPGLLLGRMGDNVVTVDFLWTPDSTKNKSACAESGGDYEDSSRTCWVPTRPLKLVSIRDNSVSTLSTSELTSDLEIFAAIDGNDRVFLPARRDGEMVVFVMGATDNELRTSVASVGDGFNNPVLSGSNLYYLDSYYLRRVDGSSPGLARDTTIKQLNSYRPNHLSVSGNMAIVSFGDAGIQAIPL
jgi:hypothetical protein